MPITRIINSLHPTTTKHEVPEVYHEPHVETGFRQTHQPWSYYFWSLFQKHNECMNSWTHLIGLLLTLGRMYEFSREFSLLSDPHMWPLTSGMITMILMYMCSTFAHCFSNKSELVHYTGFMVDYAGIGLFGFGSAILHYAYCMDETLLGSFFHRYSVTLAMILGLSIAFCCSISKTMYKRPYPFTRKIWQMGSVGAMYAWLILPIAHRLFLALLDQNNEDPGITHHSQQIFWFAVSGFFFGSDIPQRFFPGRCDFLGHSHQIFHACIVMVTIKQLDGIYSDLYFIQPHITYMSIPTFRDTFGALFGQLFFLAIIVTYFSYIAKKRIESESKSLS